MPKVDPYALRTRPRVIIERTFTDKLNPGVEVTLKLRRLSSMETVSAMDTAQDMIAQYVTGYGVEGKAGYVPPETLPPIDGQAVIISRNTARVAAVLFRSQTVPDADRYTFEEIVAFMAIDAFCEGFAQAAEDVSSLSESEEADKDPLALTPSGKG